MVRTLRSWGLRTLVAGMMLSALPAAADDSEGLVRLNGNTAEGLVRVTDQSSGLTVRAQSPDIAQASHHHVDQAVEYCPPEQGWGRCGLHEWWYANAVAYRTRNQMQSAMLREAVHADCQEKSAWAHGKFGYFIPTGCCGKGCPPVGCYSMVYPVDPSYFDPRDGQVYAASGTGGPVSVPLAPVVNHTYNYGWGIPSSRLTPVLHPATQAPPAMIPSPVPSMPVAH